MRRRAVGGGSCRPAVDWEERVVVRLRFLRRVFDDPLSDPFDDRQCNVTTVLQKLMSRTVDEHAGGVGLGPSPLLQK